MFDKPKPTKTQTNKYKHKIFLLNLHENFMDKIVDDEKNINNEMFKKYFGYHNPSFLGKDL